MKFSIVIADRGDRPQFLEHCIFQMERQTVQPSEILLVNHLPLKEGFDINERLLLGVTSSRYDRIFFIENDDYYPDNYFEVMLRYSRFNFIGIRRTIYYNIFNNRYSILNHWGEQRSSLFCTAIIKNPLIYKLFYGNNFVDLRLWEYARYTNSYYLLDLDQICPIGIKHGIGLCGGEGHRSHLLLSDQGKTWLRDHVRPESFEFYKTINK